MPYGTWVPVAVWRLWSANCYIRVTLLLLWYGGRPHSRPHCARRWTQLPLPQFSAHVCCGQTAGWIKMPLCTIVGLGPSNIVLDADPAPPQGAQPLQNFSHVCCGQTTRWIKMPLGTKVGLGPGHIVLRGDPAPPPKRGTSAQSLIFGSRLLWPNGRPSQLLLSSCWNIVLLCVVLCFNAYVVNKFHASFWQTRSIIS